MPLTIPIEIKTDSKNITPATVQTETTSISTVKFEIPKDLEAGTYTLKVFHEYVPYGTDAKQVSTYASDFVDIPIAVEDQNSAEEFTVIYSSDENPGEYGSEKVKAGEKLTQKPADPVKDGYTFLGWADTNGTLWNFDNPVEKNMSLHPSWKLNIAAPAGVEYHTGNTGDIRWSAVEGASGYLLQLYGENWEKIGEPVRVDANTTNYKFDITDTTHGYIFGVRAINQEGKTGPEKTVGVINYLPTPTNLKWDSRVVGRASWEPVEGAEKYMIQLYTTGPSGKKTPLGDPLVGTGTGYTFKIDSTLTWYTFGVRAIPKEGTKNTGYSLEAFSAVTGFDRVNVNAVDVKFDANGGFPEKLASYANVRIGDRIPEPSGVTRPGYRLAGWRFNPSRLWDFNRDRVTTAMTLTAEWEKITPDDKVKIQVKFDSNGGTPASIASQTTTLGGLIQKPVTPTKEGYALVGWLPAGAPPGYPYWDFEKDGAYPLKDGERTITLRAIWGSEEHMAGVSAVSVKKEDGSQVNGTIGSDNVITVKLPAGSKLPTDPLKILITTSKGAKASNLETKDNGQTWTFTVTSSDGKTSKDYTIKVTVEEAKLSNNTNLKSVYVGNTQASINNSTKVINVTLPKGSTISDKLNIKITTEDSKAKFTAPKTTNNGKTWTFTVTAEDGKTTAAYTLNVTVKSSGSTGGGSVTIQPSKKGQGNNAG